MNMLNIILVMFNVKGRFAALATVSAQSNELRVSLNMTDEVYRCVNTSLVCLRVYAHGNLLTDNIGHPWTRGGSLRGHGSRTRPPAPRKGE